MLWAGSVEAVDVTFELRHVDAVREAAGRMYLLTTSTYQYLIDNCAFLRHIS